MIAYIRISTLLLILAIVHQSVDAQAITKSVKDFGAKGDGKANDHAAFVRAAAFFNSRKGNGRLTIPKGTYIVGIQDRKPLIDQSGLKDRNVLQLVDCSNLVIQGEAGTVIRFRDSLRFGAFDTATVKPHHTGKNLFVDYRFAYPIGSFVVLQNCKGVTVRNIEVDGNQKGMILGGKYGDAGIQLTHDGVLIQSCESILLENLYVHHMGRDGVIIANTTPQKEETADQKMRIVSCRFEYNARQGLSWVGGKGLVVVKTKFNYTGKGRFASVPTSGIDIEGETGLLRNGIFEDCEMIDNSGAGVIADNGDSRNMKFINCTFWGIDIWSAWVTKPAFQFLNCRFFGSVVHGYNADFDVDATRYVNCHFEDRFLNGRRPYGGYLIEINNIRRIQFTNCTFLARNRRMIWVVGDPSWKDEELPLFTACQFSLKTLLKPWPEFWTKHYRLRFQNCRWSLPIAATEGRLYISGSDNLYKGSNFVQFTDTLKKID